MKYKLGIDIDGCLLALYRDQFVPIMNERYGLNKTIEDMNVGFIEAYNTNQEELTGVFGLTDDYSVNLVDPEGARILQELIDDDHFIELVTAHVPHQEQGQEPLLERLIQLKVPYNSIRFARDKEVIAHEYDFMVDDATYHLDSMINKTNPVQFIRPWNKEYNNNNVFSVNDWTEFKALIDVCSKLEINGIIGKAITIR